MMSGPNWLKGRGWKPLPLFLLLLCFLPLLSCIKKDGLDAIKESGYITLLTRNNPHCYYIYRNKPMGFEFDLAKAFSEYLGVELRWTTTTLEGFIEGLRTNKGHFVAAGMSISPSQADLIDVSNGYLAVSQQVIVHLNNYQIRKIEDLQGRTIHVRRGTSYESTLNELSEKGIGFQIKLYDETPTEELIRMVAEKEIEVTVAYSNVALLNRRYYPDVKIAFPLGEARELRWAVNKGHKPLLNTINAFFEKIKEDGTFLKIYEKYYANVEDFDYVDLKKYHIRLESRLPKYRPLIQETAKRHGFDWRLIAAMVYQESHFDPAAVSFTGVAGIMQLTQDTAGEVGIENRRDPEQSIVGGVRYLKKIYDQFDDAKNPDRLFIALASYNVGRGHILDAQEIAKQQGLEPNSWSALEQVLPLLSYRKYYKKTKNGYCRGREPVRYVNNIRTYYDILRRKA
ncbi:MAG: membrane-bound lytic murein transglycosylase MltF, partial [Pseudomonadota bacterium]